MIYDKYLWYTVPHFQTNTSCLVIDLKNTTVYSQFGLWNSEMHAKIKIMFQTTNQMDTFQLVSIWQANTCLMTWIIPKLGSNKTQKVVLAFKNKIYPGFNWNTQIGIPRLSAGPVVLEKSESAMIQFNLEPGEKPRGTAKVSLSLSASLSRYLSRYRYICVYIYMYIYI